MMNANELYYKKTVSAIGVAMLFFLLFFHLFGVGQVVMVSAFQILEPKFPILCDVLPQIYSAVGYLLSFMLPVLILKYKIGKAGYEYQPMNVTAGVSPWIFLMMPACVTVIYSAAYLNAQMLSFLDYSTFSSEVLWGEGKIAPPVYQWVLTFISTCVVPGFCEEFLFRGAILSNCRPFGRTNAILISSLLFAMMHQNPEQLLYTFVAGIFFGIVYEKTGSIWTCTLLHIFNNLISTFESVIFYKIQDALQSSIAVSLFELGLFSIGLVSLIILICRFFSVKSKPRDGIFGKSLPAADGFAACPIHSGRSVRLFLCPSMIVFFVLANLQVLLLLFLAAVY